MSMDAAGNMMPKTPAAAILAATTYLRTTQPPEDDPRAEVHRQTIIGPGMAGAALQPVAAPNVVAATAQRQPARSPRRRDDSPRHRGGPRREPQPQADRDRSEPRDARNTIAQSKFNRSRARREARESSYSDEENEDCGAPCFSREIRESRIPKNFKFTSETPKYDDTLEPKTWLEDYLTTVRCQRGTRTTAMQYLQLHLT